MERSSLERLKALAKELRGDLYIDQIAKVVYSTDASMYQILPDAIVCPAHEDDVRILIDFCRRERVPLIPRGAGTNMTGGVLGKGLVLDLSKYLNRIIDVNPEQDYALVESGVVHGRLQKELSRFGKFFPTDPSSSDYCTMGGVAANNSSGIHAVQYGDAKDWISDIQVFLSNGKKVSTEILNSYGDLRGKEFRHSDFEERIVFDVYRLLKRNFDLIKRSYPYVVKNSSGYNLKEAFDGSAIDWNRLFVGSEGTLGIFDKMRVRVADIPKHKVLSLAAFKSIEDSLLPLMDILELKPIACELLDDFLIDLIVRDNPKIRSFLPNGTSSILLIEFSSDDEAQIEKSRLGLRSVLKNAIKVVEASSRSDEDFLLGIRKASSPILNRVEGARKPVRFIEDIAVHPSRLNDFIKDLKGLLKDRGLETSVYGHVGSGNVHVNPNIDLSRRDYKKVISETGAEVYELVREYDGTITGEHGDGILRAPFVKLQYGRLTEVFKNLRSILDPYDIMNPGKKLSSSSSMDMNSLRYDHDRPSKSVDPELAEMTKCHGCGTCRAYCPVADTSSDEMDSARAKINVLRMLALGHLPSNDGTLTEARKIVKHCINCKQCLTKCPTVIDVPYLCTEAKKRLNERFGASILDLYLGDIKKVAELASESHVADLGLRNKGMRDLLEGLTGLSSLRKLPRFGERFNTQIDKNLDAPEVIYHAGCFASYNDTDEALGTIKVLKALNINVGVPDLDCCYVFAISNGTYGRYLDEIRHNVGILEGYVDRGLKIITSSASCSLALKAEYAKILGSSPSRKVAQNTFDIHEFLLKLKEDGKLNLKFKESNLKVAFHNPCHLIALRTGLDPKELLKLVPGLSIADIEDSCCGIAGTFGMKKENYGLSMRIGRKLFDAIERSGADVVLTSCGTCKMQIEEATGKKVMHTMKFLGDFLA